MSWKTNETLQKDTDATFGKDKPSTWRAFISLCRFPDRNFQNNLPGKPFRLEPGRLRHQKDSPETELTARPTAPAIAAPQPTPQTVVADQVASSEVALVFVFHNYGGVKQQLEPSLNQAGWQQASSSGMKACLDYLRPVYKVR